MPRMIRSALALALAALGGCNCTEAPHDAGPLLAGAPAEEVRVGVVLPLTGKYQQFGEETREGIEIAFADRRAPRVVLDVRDDASDEPRAAQVAVELLDGPVIALLGELDSGLSLRVAEVAQRAHVPVLSPTASSAAVVEVGPHCFRMNYGIADEARALARFAREVEHIERVGVLTDRTDTLYAAPIADLFARELTRAGGVVPVRSTYAQDQTDFSAELAELAAADLQAIYLPADFDEILPIARAMRDAGMQQQLLGSEAWHGRELRSADARALLEGSVLPSPYHVGSATPQAMAFRGAFVRRYGRDPTSYAALGYDAAQVLAQAIERAAPRRAEAPSEVRARVRDELARTSFTGATGTLRFDASRQPVRSVLIVRVTTDGLVVAGQHDP
ncbi:MAG: ABC transporter substrate-binding protein [Sandaracinaceae bacterium]|nr:ABC transporter substrate-binding protein [Sandaracinaceae bacterium]